MISIKFLLVIAMLCKTEWSWELRIWWHKTYLLDILSTSPHYFYSKWIGVTNENFNFDPRVFIHCGLIHTNPDIFEPHIFFYESAVLSARNQWPCSPKWHVFSKPPQGGLKAMLQGTIRNDDFKRNTVLQCCNHSKQCRNNVATLCCAKNRRCESSRVTSP